MQQPLIIVQYEVIVRQRQAHQHCRSLKEIPPLLPRLLCIRSIGFVRSATGLSALVRCPIPSTLWTLNAVAKERRWTLAVRSLITRPVSPRFPVLPRLCLVSLVLSLCVSSFNLSPPSRSIAMRYAGLRWAGISHSHFCGLIGHRESETACGRREIMLPWTRHVIFNTGLKSR